MTTRLAAVLLLVASAIGQSEPIAVLPMTIDKNLPIAPISVNGNSGLNFILDTAASGCVIDKETASRLGLVSNRSVQAGGSGGLEQGGFLDEVHLNIGGVELARMGCVILDLKALNFKTQVDGVLGRYAFFADYVIELDYPGLLVRLYKANSYQASPKAESLPIRVTVGPILRGQIRAGGKEFELKMVVDTGSAHVLTICTPTVDRLGLLKLVADARSGQTHGIGGASADFSGHIEEIRVGNASMKNPLVRLSRHNEGAFATEKNASGNLGGEFLKQYKVTVDFSGSRLLLEAPVPNSP